MTDEKTKEKCGDSVVKEVEASLEVGTPVSMATRTGPAECPQYIMEEEYTVGVPLVRPKPEFLSLLKTAGASGEIFTKKEICQLLKDYISSRQLYDPNDPRVVYCGTDPLGKVFNVDKFTIEEVLSLLSKNYTQVPDTCLKRKRHLVSRPMPHPSFSTSQTQSASFTIAVCQASPVITSSTDAYGHLPYDHDLRPRKTTSCSSLKQRKSSSSSTGSCKKKQKVALNQSSLTLSTKTGTENQSQQEDGHSPEDGKQSEESKLAEGSQTNKRKRDRKRRRKSGKDSGHSPSQASEPIEEPGPSRKRGTSLSITYNDSEDSSYPWYFQLQVQNADDDQESEILSVQDKTTATVQDSTDDLWFVEEESISVEVDTDGEFSVEYDIESAEDSPLTESDIGSIKSGEGLLVVCKESDVEFFADESDSDSEDTEITEADKWICLECKHVNLPLQRYCDRCWKLRAGWLPDIANVNANKQRNRSKQCQALSESDKISNNSEQMAENNKLSFEIVKSAITDSAEFDSGIGSLSSNYPSSQETVKSNIFASRKDSATSEVKLAEEKNPEKGDLSLFQNSNTNSKGSSLYHDIQATEVRHSFLNYRKSNSTSVESLESPHKEDKHKISGGKSLTLPINDPCMICLTKPKSASLVHGSSGHQVCCFQCGKRLKRRGKVCPVCRRPIQKVIKNYIL